MFDALPSKPDHDALELAILDRWERERTFDQLRAKNADGPRFSFIDGPVTANKSLAVHTAWGRTLKDVFQRYKALQRLPPALPERLRLPGPVDRGGRRARARPELQAGDRGVRAGGVRAPLPGGGRAVVGRAHQGLDPPRPVDGLGQRLLHVLRHQHRVHLALPADRPRPRAGSSGATAPRSGARAAARRSRPTSSSAATSTARTRRCPCGSRCSTAPARRSSSGPPPRGPCPANVAVAVNPDRPLRPPAERRLDRRRASRRRREFVETLARRRARRAGATRGPSTTSGRARTSPTG